MKITVISANELTPDHVHAWTCVQQTNADLESPFFRPEFTQLVASARGDVEVAVLEEGGEPAGFFPFERRFRWRAGPVGGRLNDFQGVIARPGLNWRADELIKACDLTAWDFDHLLPSQQPFGNYHFATGSSPYMDVSAGFDAYYSERYRKGSRDFREIARKIRKVEREVGPIRFELHTDDREVLTTLLCWKSEQYRRARVTDVFAFPWAAQLLEQVQLQKDDAFAGNLSTLYFGDRLAAVELMLRSGHVLHGWFPAYDPDLGRYSPGVILSFELARAMPARGLRRYHMGKGETRHKNTFATGAIPLASGCVTLDPLDGLLRYSWHQSWSVMRGWRFLAPARLLGRWTRPLRGWLAFH
jgi:CelD/BcsL family acetyltransferase involved in cellulose biosynthesis